MSNVHIFGDPACIRDPACISSFTVNLLWNPIFLSKLTLRDHEHETNASRDVPVYAPAFPDRLRLRMRDGQAELTWVAGWLHITMITHAST